MTIEPISSAMTYQAQTQMTKPVERTSETGTDAAQISTEAPVDKNTMTVKEPEETDGKHGQGNGSQTEGQPQQQQVSQETLKKQIDELNKKMKNSEAIFGIHEDTKRLTIKIIDKETKEVIKEVPPEKTLDMIAKVWEMAGILVDEKR